MRSTRPGPPSCESSFHDESSSALLKSGMGHICGGDGGGGEGDCLDSKAAASSGVEHIRTLLVIEAVVMSNRVQSVGGTRIVHPSGFSAASLFSRAHRTQKGRAIQVSRNPVSVTLFLLTFRLRAHSSRVLVIMYMRESRSHVFVYSTRESSFLPCVCLLSTRYLFDIACSLSKQARAVPYRVPT